MEYCFSCFFLFCQVGVYPLYTENIIRMPSYVCCTTAAVLL